MARVESELEIPQQCPSQVAFVGLECSRRGKGNVPLNATETAENIEM